MADTPPRPRRPLGALRLLAFSGFALLLFLLLLEGGLQLLAWASGPQTRLPEADELPAPDPSAIRVVAVGDSWVYGAESEPQEAFIEVFAAGLRERTGRPVQVYNLGVSASNSAQALLALDRVVEPVAPRYVVALTGANNLLHDRGVQEAARRMGEDLRMGPWSWLAWSRLARLVRLVWINVFAEHGERTTPASPGIDLLDAPGTDPAGSTGLPPAPAVHRAETVELPWWRAFLSRNWEVGLQTLRATTPPTDSAELRGVQAAWEALFLAQLERFDEAEARAVVAMELGGDRATAWEARAVAAERQDRPLFALQHRIRASDTPGNPWIRERARALALLELEAWEASQRWLLSVLSATPGEYDALMALARLPGAARDEVTEAQLRMGPRRGRVLQNEYFEWHLVSSAMLDRAAESLGEPDPDEPAAMRLARARLAELTERPEEARAAYAALAEDGDLRELDRARGRAGLLRTAREGPLARRVREAPVAALFDELTAGEAPEAVAVARAVGDCERALALGARGLELGMSAASFERAAGDCLPRAVGWALTEQALGRDVILDRAALILGLPAGRVPGPVPPPALPFWEDFQGRRFEAVLPVADGGWRALALAHLDRPGDALAAADQALAAATGDPSAAHLARAFALRRLGDFRGTLVACTEAALAEGDPWLRMMARGTARAMALRWAAAQQDLLAVLRAAPGYLEALEVLSEVPEQVRFPATQTALRWTPSGRVPAHRWSAWYLAQGRGREAELALRWPRLRGETDPGLLGERALAGARVAEAEGDFGRAEALFAEAAARFEEAGRAHRACAARAGGLELDLEAVPEEELERLVAECSTYAPALEFGGRLAARRSDCRASTVWARAAWEAGADPAELLAWIEPCTPQETFELWVDKRMTAPGVPPIAREWMRSRLRPDDEDAPGRPDRRAGLLVRHLRAMKGLAEADGAEFIALTYPFPGAHHLRVRDAILRDAPAEGIRVLDLYGHFEATFTEQEWQQMRTPEDHVDARGYREMGEQLLEALAPRR